MTYFTSGEKVSRKQFILGAIFIAVFTFIAYSQVFDAGYIWDDHAHVSQNPTLKDFHGLKQIWLQARQPVQYYPLTFTAFWVQYQLWGNNSQGYHLFNIFLHVVNATMVWTILQRLGVRGAFYIAVIFAVHPVHVESVAWITELKNILSTMFYLLAVKAFLYSCSPENASQKSDSSNILNYCLSLVFFVFSLLSKTVTCTLPVILLLLVWWKKNGIDRRDLKRILPFFILAVAPTVHTAWLEANKYGAIGTDWDFTYVERILIASRALYFYVVKLLVPLNLTFSYPRFNIDPSEWAQYLYVLVDLAVVYYLWMMRKKIGKGPLVGVLFFVITIAPALGFINFFTMLYSFVADHYQYTASIGLITLFVAGIINLISKRTDSIVVINSIFIVLFIIYGTLTWHQCRIYKNPLTLYEDIIEKNPNSWFAYNNRAVYFEQNGDLEQALEYYTKSINLKPYAYLYLNRGNIYLKDHKYQLAIADYNKAIELSPSMANIYNNRGNVYLNIKEYELALKDFNRALFLEPNFTQPLMNIGIIYGYKKEHQNALRYFEKAIANSENYSLIYYYRSQVYKDIGEIKLALQDMKKAVSLGYVVPDEYIEEMKDLERRYKK